MVPVRWSDAVRTDYADCRNASGVRENCACPAAVRRHDQLAGHPVGARVPAAAGIVAAGVVAAGIVAAGVALVVLAPTRAKSRV